jgi:ABC-type polysaccharide/polyol phosphate transport system ATPase subunit
MAQNRALALECRGVTKRFYHYDHRTTTLAELVVRTVRREPIHIRRPHFELHRLDLAVRRGEAVALIGPNGSGKSTALRLIAGIYPATEGAVYRYGRVVAVLELGTTFQPDLTGLENVQLYAAALGLSRRDLTERTPEIFAFSEVGDFADVPIKYYSSGMRSRLAFAIAACAEPDILLLDEVLAVGDESFRRRCLERLRLFNAAGGTLIVVSHDLETVRTLCTRAVWLERGEVHMSGDAGELIDAYLASAGRG